MSDPKKKLTGPEIDAAGLADWTHVLSTLQTRFVTGDFATGLALAERIGGAAEAANHHPDLFLTYPSLTVTLTSHDVGGITSRDIDLAARISDFATAAGVQADPKSISHVEWGLDTGLSQQVAPFWAAITGAEVSSDDPAGEVVDPQGRMPNLWFQTPDASYEPNEGEPDQRWHPDIWVGAGEAEDRIARAVAAGGVLVDDSFAPAFWVLADAEGNRACICTTQSR